MMLDNCTQRIVGTTMTIWRGQGNVAQRRGAESQNVILITGYLLTALVFKAIGTAATARTNLRHSNGVKALVGLVQTTVTLCTGMSVTVTLVE